MNEALKHAFTLGPFNHNENIPPKFKKAKEDPVVTVFKAKKMPNFQAIHQKLSVNSKSNDVSFSKSSNLSTSFTRPSNLISSKGGSFLK